MKIGRPKRNFELDAKTTIVGLCSLGEGRWRISLDGPHKGKRFNERDPHLAVQKFRQIVGETPRVIIPAATVSASDLVSDEPTLRAEIIEKPQYKNSGCRQSTPPHPPRQK